MSGYPLIVLSHRKREFLETTLATLREHAHGVGEIIVVDDSGDADHHDWLLSNGYAHGFSSPDRSHVGYLGAMQTIWEIVRAYDSHVMLWEEDFVLTKPLYAADAAYLLDKNPGLAQVNFQRQAVYRIEKRFGYMQSHQRRGYELSVGRTEDIAWVKRRRPFTTNPSMVRREIFDIDWPTRAEADLVPGGAEPAMSALLEKSGYHFGWLGLPNTPHTKHVGTTMKSGKGY